MTIEYKCKKQVLSNVWHHNLLIDGYKKVFKENSEVPATPNEVIELIKDGIIIPDDGWVVDC